VNSSFLSKLVHLVIGKYLVDPVAPFGHLHFFQGSVHLVFEGVLGFTSYPISYDPVGQLLNTAGLHIDHITVNLVFVQDQVSLLQLFAFDYRNHTITLGLENIV
jgi:hypothetical protein